MPRVRSESPATEVGTSIELFTGGGGLAIGMHQARFRHLLAVEIDRRACQTLRAGGGAIAYDPEAEIPGSLDDPWPIFEGDIHKQDFGRWEGLVDVVAGGVPASRGA